MFRMFKKKCRFCGRVVDKNDDNAIIFGWEGIAWHHSCYYEFGKMKSEGKGK